MLTKVTVPQKDPGTNHISCYSSSGWVICRDMWSGEACDLGSYVTRGGMWPKDATLLLWTSDTSLLDKKMNTFQDFLKKQSCSLIQCKQSIYCSVSLNCSVSHPPRSISMTLAVPQSGLCGICDVMLAYFPTEWQQQPLPHRRHNCPLKSLRLKS